MKPLCGMRRSSVGRVGWPRRSMWSGVWAAPRSWVEGRRGGLIEVTFLPVGFGRQLRRRLVTQHAAPTAAAFGSAARPFAAGSPSAGSQDCRTFGAARTPTATAAVRGKLPNRRSNHEHERPTCRRRRRGGQSRRVWGWKLAISSVVWQLEARVTLPRPGSQSGESGNRPGMTAMGRNTNWWRVIRYAVAGALILNIVTVVWAFYTSTRTAVIAAIVLGVVGGAIGGCFGWATASNRWGRWWAEGRTHRGPIRGSERR
jgi:hypothetical protein